MQGKCQFRKVIKLFLEKVQHDCVAAGGEKYNVCALKPSRKLNLNFTGIIKNS